MGSDLACEPKTRFRGWHSAIFQGRFTGTHWISIFAVAGRGCLRRIGCPTQYRSPRAWSPAYRHWNEEQGWSIVGSVQERRTSQRVFRGLVVVQHSGMMPNKRLETDHRTRSLRSLASSAQPKRLGTHLNCMLSNYALDKFVAPEI